jgi:UDP-glucose 4-epimerase
MEEAAVLVVVAGGAGFLGASLVDRLQAEGDEVVVVDDLSHGHLANLAEARRRGGVRFHRMDVGQGGLATLADRVRADAWVHLATGIDPARAWGDPTGEARTVVPGGVEVLKAAAATGARAVIASSAAYLYPGQLTGATTADDRPRPVHPFGAARLALEAYTGAFTARGLDVVLLLLGTVYGPRQDPLGPGLVARAAWSMLQGRPPRVDGEGRQERDFLFVDDAVDAVARAVHASPPPGRVVVGTGTATSVLDVVEQLAARIGWEGEPEWAPARPGDPRRSALDPGAAGRALGWQPWTRLDEGLGLTVDWLKARLPGHHRHIGRPLDTP